MAAPYTVVVADFLTEAGVETAVLGDLARVVLAGARSEEELWPFLADADALILYHDVATMGAASFERASKCRGLVRAGVGYNNIDLAAADRAGLTVCNVPDYGSEEVADHAILLLLAVVRRLIPSHESVRGGSWVFAPALGTPRLRGRTLGIVGCGRIGTAAALRARAFGMEVVFYDPHKPRGYEKAIGVGRADSLQDLLRRSDFVSLHCPLNDSTRHLIDARALSAMRPGAVLVNTSRGPVVDQSALLEALDGGRLQGAGLDVAEREPLDDDRLRYHPRVVWTPHSAFYSVEGFVEMRTKAAEEVRRLLLGEAPWNRVNDPVARPS